MSLSLRPCLYVSDSMPLSLRLCLYVYIYAFCFYVSVSMPLSLRLCLYVSVLMSCAKFSYMSNVLFRDPIRVSPQNCADMKLQIKTIMRNLTVLSPLRSCLHVFGPVSRSPHLCLHVSVSTYLSQCLCHCCLTYN